QATRDAAKLAGLEVLRLLNAPTAAALAYGLEQRKNGPFAGYDLAGGTFDITILSLEDGVFQVRSTGGDSQLGGDDFDREIVRNMLPCVGFDSERDVPREVVSLLLSVARQLKHGLTDAPSVEVTLPRRGGGDTVFTASRAE